MEKKEAYLIAEEVLRTVVSLEDEDLHNYICDKLDISDESLVEALKIISNDNVEKK